MARGEVRTLDRMEEPGQTVGTYSSTGARPDYCFWGQRQGNSYVGTVNSVTGSMPTYREISRRSMSMGQILAGNRADNAPSWFKKRARPTLNGSNSCGVS